MAGIIVFRPREGLVRLGVPEPSLNCGCCHHPGPGLRVLLGLSCAFSLPLCWDEKLLFDLEKNPQGLGKQQQCSERRGLWMGEGPSAPRFTCDVAQHRPPAFPVARGLGERGTGGTGRAPLLRAQPGERQRCQHCGCDVPWLCRGRP